MDFRKLLKEHNFSLTEGRIQLMETLSAADCPLSEKEIEILLPAAINKTTIYRNLSSLSEKGLVQKIISGDSFKYKLNSSYIHKNHNNEHIHFQCSRCNRVICMEDLKVKEYTLPKGYDKIENQFLIIGICKDCNEKE
ncbi:MAG: Fur family transcriptional regulator [Bacteroidota bacterium]